MPDIDNGGQMHKAGFIKMVIDSNLTPPYSQFYSCGSEDSVKVWEKTASGLSSSEFPTTGKNLGLIAVNKNIYIGEQSTDLLSGATKHVVVCYDKNTKLASDAYLDFSMPVSALDVSPDGSLIVAGGEDYVLKFRREVNNEQIRDRKDVNGLPVSISCSPSSKFVAISTSDGDVTVYEVSDVISEKASFKTNRGFNQIENDTSRMQCAWHPTGMNLYIPSDDGIFVIACRDWTKEKTLVPESLSMEEFSICAISLEGRFLASYTLNGNIYVHRTSTYDLISTINLEAPSIKVMSMMFDPLIEGDEDDYDLLLADQFGKLSIVRNATKPTTNEKLGDEDQDLDDFFGAISDEDDDIAKIKENYGFSQKKETAAPKLPPDVLESLGKLKQPLLTTTRTRLPKPFVSGSAPEKNGERYLKWNAFGMIKSFDSDGVSNLLIEFHDASIHPEVMMDNSESGFTMGDLNKSAIALASGESLCVLIVSTFDVDSKRWSIRMPDNEEIKNVAVGSSFVAVYTNERYVRIFTICGTQRAVFSSDAPVITMSASDSFLVLATATGGLIVHSEDCIEHELRADIYRINALLGSPDVVQRLKSTPIALSPEATLSWFSFSTGGQICTMDSDFVVRRLAPSNFWMPIFEGSNVLKSEEHAFWPIAVLDADSHLLEPKMRYLLCKSCSFPIPSKKLVPLTDKWDLPLCDKESGRTALEGDLMRNELVYSASKLAKSLGQSNSTDIAKLAKEHLATLLKLFSLAINGGKENRAHELASIAHTDQGIQMMCNLAAKKGRGTLKNKIEEFGLSKSELKENASVSLYSEEPVLAPMKTVTLKRKSISQLTTKKIYDKENYGLPPTKKVVYEESQDLFQTEQEESMTIRPTINESMELDMSLNSSLVTGKNPFKKVGDASQSSTSTPTDDFFASMSVGISSGKQQQQKSKKMTQSQLKATCHR